MKTRLEWYNDLPEDIREKAVKNTSEGYLNQKEPNLHKAVIRAFDWQESPEKGHFWYYVSNGQYDEAREILKQG